MLGEILKMRQNPSTASEIQSKTISENVNIALRGVDLNYLGNKPIRPHSKEKKVVLSGVDADVNRVLFWLSSKRDDYVRSYLKGGVLYDLLGSLASEPNLEYWKEEIARRFNSEFSGEMSLFFIELTVNKKTRTLIVNMVVRDNFRNITFPINTEAAL